MPIDPLLGPGLEAFRRSDYAAAAVDWQRRAEALQGEPRRVATVLTRLAQALEAAGEARVETADDRYAAARLGLEALPDRALGLDLARLRRQLPLTAEAALATPPALSAAPLLPRGPLLRFTLFVVLVGAAVAAARWTPLADLLTRETLVATLGRLREVWWSPLLLIALFVVLCPLGLPASPLMLTGGIVFGAAWGTLYNFLGTLGGAVGGYLLARHLGTDLLRHFAGARLRRIERLLARHGFWYMAGVRFLPLPFPAVNFAMALGGVRLGTFTLASALGLAPAIAIWTYFAAAIYEAATSQTTGPDSRQLVVRLTVALALVGFIITLPALINRRLRRRRYRRLKARRARRG